MDPAFIHSGHWLVTAMQRLTLKMEQRLKTGKRANLYAWCVTAKVVNIQNMHPRKATDMMVFTR